MTWFPLGHRLRVSRSCVTSLKDKLGCLLFQDRVLDRIQEDRRRWAFLRLAEVLWWWAASSKALAKRFACHHRGLIPGTQGGGR